MSGTSRRQGAAGVVPLKGRSISSQASSLLVSLCQAATKWLAVLHCGILQ